MPQAANSTHAFYRGCCRQRRQLGLYNLDIGTEALLREGPSTMSFSVLFPEVGPRDQAARNRRAWLPRIERCALRYGPIQPTQRTSSSRIKREPEQPFQEPRPFNSILSEYATPHLASASYFRNTHSPARTTTPATANTATIARTASVCAYRRTTPTKADSGFVPVAGRCSPVAKNRFVELPFDGHQNGVAFVAPRFIDLLFFLLLGPVNLTERRLHRFGRIDAANPGAAPVARKKARKNPGPSSFC